MTLSPELRAQHDRRVAENLKARQTLARWPKGQREKALRLEQFQTENNAILLNVITREFKGFKGAEVVESEQANEMRNRIQNLDVQRYFPGYSKEELALAKTSLADYLRDYQFRNNRYVRSLAEPGK